MPSRIGWKTAIARSGRGNTSDPGIAFRRGSLHHRGYRALRLHPCRRPGGFDLTRFPAIRAWLARVADEQGISRCTGSRSLPQRNECWNAKAFGLSPRKRRASYTAAAPIRVQTPLPSSGVIRGTLLKRSLFRLPCASALHLQGSTPPANRTLGTEHRTVAIAEFIASVALALSTLIAATVGLGRSCASGCGQQRDRQ